VRKPLRTEIGGRPKGDSAARQIDAADAVRLSRYWYPRYWPVWLFILWLRFAAALPWRMAIMLHKGLGRAAGALSGRRGRVVRRNLEICFPELSHSEREALAKRFYANLGAFIGEIGIAWFGSGVHKRFRIEGIEYLHGALAKGKGVLLFSGHFTPLEISVPVIKSLVPFFAFMFRERRNALFNAMQTRGRLRTAHVALVNNDIRVVLKMLSRNAVVWYAPDEARIDSGELLPFFGEPAMTSTATSRLARLSGATIIPMFFRRLADESGYLLRFQAPLVDLPTDDATHDTRRLISVLEGFVRECPEQYFWTPRRFKDRPGGLPNAYQSGRVESRD